MIAEKIQSVPVTLSDLIPSVTLPADICNLPIASIVSDSRAVKQHALFCGLSGAQFNSKRFVTEAAHLGAAAIVIDQDDTSSDDNVITYVTCEQRVVPVITIKNLRAELSVIAGRFYDHPSKKMCLVGVTGTNGKSSCVGLLVEIWKRFNVKAASIGTLGYGDDVGSLVGTGMTTPDTIDCQKILSTFYRNNMTHVAMEVSSHGIDQYRVAALQFSIVIITNITHDHLDYHKTLEEYVRVKSSFISAPEHDAAIVNADDSWCRKILENTTNQRTFSYSLKDSTADVYVVHAVYSVYGITARISTPWGSGLIRSRLVGEFNLSNLLAVITAVCVSGFSFQYALNIVSFINAVPGRMQKIQPSHSQLSDIHVSIDFAHTPDALEKVMHTMRQFTDGELWVVFGCGGNRDRGKRVTMGRVVSMLADKAIVTSDNPRNEDPQLIIDDIVVGMESNEAVITLVDREAAIAYAIKHAAPGSAVLIAGKGHEAYQEVNGKKNAFDDALMAQKYLDARIALIAQASLNSVVT